MNNKDMVHTTSHKEVSLITGELESVWESEFDKSSIPVDYMGSEASYTDEDYIRWGKYYRYPINIFNKRTGEIETLPRATSERYLFWMDYLYITSPCYPIYDIDNKYIGYVVNGFNIYANEYLWRRNKKAWLKKNFNPTWVFIGIALGYVIFTIITQS